MASARSRGEDGRDKAKLAIPSGDVEMLRAMLLVSNPRKMPTRSLV
jgi:hypothetical protein